MPSGGPLARAAGLSVATIFGGTPHRPQVAALHNRVDIIVARPGRLADPIGQGHCHLGDVEVSVVDEADHMAGVGFLPAVRRLLDAAPPEGQRMLFSATLDRAVDVLARQFLDHPAEHAADPPGAPAPIVATCSPSHPPTGRQWSPPLPPEATGRWASPGPSMAQARPPADRGAHPRCRAARKPHPGRPRA